MGPVPSMPGKSYFLCFLYFMYLSFFFLKKKIGLASCWCTRWNWFNSWNICWIHLNTNILIPFHLTILLFFLITYLYLPFYPFFFPSFFFFDAFNFFFSFSVIFFYFFFILYIYFKYAGLFLYVCVCFFFCSITKCVTRIVNIYFRPRPCLGRSVPPELFSVLL